MDKTEEKDKKEEEEQEQQEKKKRRIGRPCIIKTDKAKFKKEKKEVVIDFL
jgi:NAD(P)H-hydrate repair Nnr-like enzyme with NAD(P)H-hydrate epimerase domain